VNLRWIYQRQRSLVGGGGQYLPDQRSRTLFRKACAQCSNAGKNNINAGFNHAEDLPASLTAGMRHHGAHTSVVVTAGRHGMVLAATRGKRNTMSNMLQRA
jgi:hypothetical protein